MTKMLSEYAKSRDNNFNLIRFIAAALVLYTHSFALAIGTGDAEPLRATLGMTWGSIAVDVFFVTSGFLIATSFFGRGNIYSFIWARVLRIYPALIVATTFCVFVVGLLFTENTVSEFLSSVQTYKYFLKNITLYFGVEYNLPGVFLNTPYKEAVNGSIWTLPFEVKMYAYLAIIASVFMYFKDRLPSTAKANIFLMIAVAAVVLNIGNHFKTMFSIEAVKLFAMFFVGVAFYANKEKIIISTKLFAVLVVLLAFSAMHKDIFFVVYTLAVPYMIFYIAYVPGGFIRGFNAFGDYSYGLYIYAFPVQQSVAALIPGVSVAMMIVLSFIGTFVLAFLSWHLIEKKALRMKGSYMVLEKGMNKIQYLLFPKSKPSV